MTDEALMLAVRNGDLDRLTPLFQRYWRPLFGFFYRMSGDRGFAEDLSSTVGSEAWNSRDLKSRPH